VHSFLQAEAAPNEGPREAAAFRLQHACTDFLQHAIVGGWKACEASSTDGAKKARISASAVQSRDSPHVYSVALGTPGEYSSVCSSAVSVTVSCDRAAGTGSLSLR
jgi:hypothetical protein